MYEFYTAVELK